MPTEEEKKATSADYYFDPGARFSTHEQLIKDNVRQSCLSGCIRANKKMIQGKQVLVVGSGLGLLAMECARQGGAAKVVGIDTSAIVSKANEVAKENQMDDRVTFIQGKVDGDVELPFEPGTVDIILCEWVGNILTNEPVLKQLIAARDKYLKPEGTIIPDKASIHLTSCADRDYKNESLGFWDNVYGFRMLPMKKLVLDSPAVSPIPEEMIVSTACELHTIDAYKVTEADLAFEAPFTLKSTHDGETINYLIAYLTINLVKEGWKGFTMLTSPDSETTYLQQCCFTLQEDLPVNKDDKVTGVFKASPGESKCDITANISLKGSVHTTEYSQSYEYYH